ncbi:nucleotidyltransferase domain-containing protein [Candidatus Woesearchaeota archaeon]|nr:nucleotidyltransferase domain-containing protein [Candidatus Woesearchaeota archaeon]
MKEDLRQLLKKYKDIEDFYIFGSFVKGKFKPSDIDVALITQEKDFKLLSSVLKEVKEYHNLHIEMFLFKEIFTEPVWKSLLSEGFSIKKNKYLRDLMDIKSGVLYKYSLKKMNRSEKTMFNRAFTEELKTTKGNSVSAGSVIIPIEKEKEFDDFLGCWEKIEKKKWRILIL